MANSLYDTCLPDVLPFTKDCPPVVAINAIRNASIEFLKKTQAWQIDLTPMDVTAGIGDYALDTNTAMPTTTELCGIMFASYGGWPIVGKSADELAKIYRWYDWRNWQGDPRYYHQVEYNKIFVVPQPVNTTTTQPLSVRVAVCPTRTSTGMDSVLQEMHYEAICVGARARLYEMAGQPFADANMAATMSARFSMMINKVRIQINTSIQRNSTVVEKQGYVL